MAGDGGRRQKTAGDSRRRRETLEWETAGNGQETARDGRRRLETAGDGRRRERSWTRTRACTQDRLRRIHGQGAHDLNANSGPDADAGPGMDASPDAHAGFSCVFSSCAAVLVVALQPPDGNQVGGLPPAPSIETVVVGRPGGLSELL